MSGHVADFFRHFHPNPAIFFFPFVNNRRTFATLWRRKKVGDFACSAFFFCARLLPLAHTLLFTLQNDSFKLISLNFGCEKNKRIERGKNRDFWWGQFSIYNRVQFGNIVSGRKEDHHFKCNLLYVVCSLTKILSFQKQK